MSRLRHTSLLVILLALGCLALGGLAGCEDDTPKFPPACPSLGLLRDAADLTRYAGSGRDLSDLLVDARITAVPARCERGPRGIVKATLQVTLDVTRGPAAHGQPLVIPYFVAVTEGDRVLDEQDYASPAALPPNVDRTQFTSDDIVLNLPVTPSKSAAAYQIYVGFRLSPDELAINRERGPR